VSKSLPKISIERPVAVAMLFLGICFLGLISYTRLPIDLLPDVAYPKLVIYTSYTDVAPAEVERLVTTPIERAVSAVPGVEKVESVSRQGISLVTLRFAWGTEMDFAALNVREKLDNIRSTLPQRVDRPVILRTDPSSDPIMALSVSGRTDLWAMKNLADEVFKRRLEQIDGVAQAAVVGGLEREIHVDVDPHKLESYGLTINDVATALNNANQSAPGGTIRKGRYQYSLRTLGEFQSIDQIGQVVVPKSGGSGGSADSSGSGGTGMVTVADVATVTDGFRDRTSITRYNGAEAVGLLLFKESGANTVRVTHRVQDVLTELRQEYPDVHIDVAMSQAGFITDAISNVVQSLVFGGILAFLVLFLFLKDVRFPVAISLAIPISVIAAFPLLQLTGVSLNVMSLGGLALGVGMLVDNSIVVLENVFRHRELGTPPTLAAVFGAQEVQNAIAASTLTTISVFGPIIYVQGVAGQLFRSLSLAVTFALLASLLVALTLLPAMAARWTGDRVIRPPKFVRRPLDAFDRWFERFADWYHGVLEAALRHRGRVMAISFVLFIGAVALGFTLKRSVLPQVDQGSFEARLTLPRGTPLDVTASESARLEKIFHDDPGVDAVFSRIGRQEAVAGVEDEQSGLNTAVLEVRLKPGAKTAATLGRLRPAFASFPVGELTIDASRATALGRLLGENTADIAIRVRGENLDASYDYAHALEDQLGKEQPLDNVRLATESGNPEVRVEIDREQAASYGIPAVDIANAVDRYMRGDQATEFVDFDRKVPVIVRLPDSARTSLSSLQDLRVDGVPLTELVHTYEDVGPSEIRRVDQARTVTVYADVASGSLDNALGDIRAIIAKSPPPNGLRVDVGGENEERQAGYRALGFAFALAMLLVYMILAAQFESFVHPFTILLSVPLSAFGAIVLLWVTGDGINTMSLIGFVILVGIVVNDAIVKVDFINQLRAKGMAIHDAILQAGRDRLRPIIMTTVTTVFGLLPMALGIGRGADLRAPLAVAVIGGISSATLLTLVVVPIAYDLVEEGMGKVKQLFGVKAAEAAEAAGAAGSAGGVE